MPIEDWPVGGNVDDDDVNRNIIILMKRVPTR